jgi:TonB family protein
MELRNNVVLSVVVHATVLTLGLVLFERGAVLRAPQKYIAVRLLKSEIAKDQTSGDSRKGPLKKEEPAAVKKRERISEKIIRLMPSREKEPPSSPLAERSDITRNTAASPTGDPSGVRTEQTDRVTDDSGFPYGTIRFEDYSGSTTGKVADDGENMAAGREIPPAGLIRTAIEKAIRYPVLARKRGIGGTVIAEFGVDERGLPVDLKVLRSSGWKILDSAALETVNRAAPFPAIKGRIEIPITFKLK